MLASVRLTRTVPKRLHLYTTRAMTTGVFKYIDTTTSVSSKPWTKVDVSASSFTLADHPAPVSNIRGHTPAHTTDTSGFTLLHSPGPNVDFTSDAQVRGEYYASIEALLRANLAGVAHVHIFDHTIRRHNPDSARQPVQQVHVDQTPAAAAARVRRHLPADKVDALLAGRYQIINAWRPIGHAADDFPLAVIDWRSTRPEDFVPVDLLYPLRTDGDDDDRGKEVRPTGDLKSTRGYEVKGETYSVQHADAHRFWYAKSMTPDEVLLLKCFDSYSRTITGKGDVAHGTPHTAFVDPQTPEGAKGRESIEVRCLVFYDD